ncbi:LacI family DNA-binding transcriptional regulator [Herbiconiux sp. CPCC 203407]|uniref:LacI family DNA-binding transcriptional regulator n=1 Tax=Herbiconiux oxytropis TaxID=2970915 RepID=A0AA41XFL6_9MICO|nr:LacI family DNA-binding transcriptional regulator [Herbiconiux oxytropis]MCS5721995.1 LacI family DNA-binding transcriptional regulator [Herbiconiux oxytropis]MCS5725578.1 LacI family DNA-binding transcriptional regulator [Herbiconiux oxytropis]
MTPDDSSGAPAGPASVQRRRRSATKGLTLTDVAEAAGVSTQTVSRVIRDHPDVSEYTREHVTETIRRIGYVPNLSARNLASNVSKLIATVVPSISTSVFAETMAAAADVLAPAGYQMILGVTDYSPEAEEQLVSKLLGRQPDGVLLVGVMHTPTATRMLAASGVPVVETWGWTDSPIGSLVGFPNDDAMADLLTALLARGYRNPVFVGSTEAGDVRARERFSGFRRAWDHARPGEAVRFVDAAGRPLSLPSGDELLGEVRSRYADTDVIVFATDILASGAILGAARRGWTVPDEIAITGFGDFELASALLPALSTVTIEAARIGREAAEILLDQIAAPRSAPRTVDVGYRITLREST